MKGLLPWLLLSFSLVFAAVWLLLASRRYKEAESIGRRLEGAATRAVATRSGWLQRQFDRAGLRPESGRIVIIGGAILTFVLVLFSPVLGLSFLISVGVFLLIFLQWRYRQRMQKMVRQLPRFLDHVVRGLYTGRTLGDAMFSAHEESEEPLYGIIGRVRRSVSLGVAFPESFQEIADRYAVKELQILALGIRVNSRYGGNMSDLVSNVIRFINEREKLSGQLHAMTGETRISAGVLAVVPVAIAVYILAMNPSYLTSMWYDASGRNWILFALALQVSGVLVIWRMLRSI